LRPRLPPNPEAEGDDAIIAALEPGYDDLDLNLVRRTKPRLPSRRSYDWQANRQGSRRADASATP
jgi:hypothetical protein